MVKKDPGAISREILFKALTVPVRLLNETESPLIEMWGALDMIYAILINLSVFV